MKYYKTIENNYIIGIEFGKYGKLEITKDEYDTIAKTIKNRPNAPDGSTYKLKTDLTWELVEIPPQPETEAEATEQDYQNALFDLGVESND